MIKLNWHTLNDDKFGNALAKLRQEVEKFPAQAKYRIGGISQVIYFEMLNAQAEAKRLLEKYAKKDEKGEIEGYPDQAKIKFETPENEKDYDAAFQEMLKTRVRIKYEPITVSTLDGTSLTAQELVALSPILSDV